MMLLPDNLDDATLEFAARQIEESSLLDIIGVMAKRKRDREDADLRMRARTELRAEIASYLRAMMGRADLTAISVLRRLSELGDHDHITYLRDAWPLAWKGLVDIKVTILCNDNCIPPRAEYRITLTKRGRELLS